MEALGSLLRQTREARGLTIAEVAHDTFIRSQYVIALEKGDLSKLPEMVYVRGFIKHYGEYLGLNGQALADRAQPLITQRSTPTPAPTLPPQRLEGSFQFRPLHLWTAYLILVIFAVGVLSAFLEGRVSPFAAWFNNANPETSSNNPETVTSLPRIFPSIQDWTRIDGIYPSSTPPLFGPRVSQPVQIGIRIEDSPSWLRVVADGQIIFEDTLQPGSQRNWTAERSIVIRAGNAGGVLLTYNNQNLGVMGDFGEVKEQIFEP
ncbi:MAG: helix-turn-helix domain-containing protein [Synechococcaceae cyanobacterium SM2_3_1]|nr:helix-turn-helix domain-containing protein [Synechococcaceae cyanobacterium SM2_3_1]